MPSIPEGFVLIDPQITTEIKAKLIGDYVVIKQVPCPDCDHDGSFCDSCEGSCVKHISVTVCWTTIKQIIKDALALMTIKAVPKPTEQK